MHDDVAKSITVQELQRTKEEFMCHTTHEPLHELYDEMELWQWDEVQHNRWARVLKAGGRATDMVCGGSGARRKTIELGNGN